MGNCGRIWGGDVCKHTPVTHHAELQLLACFPHHICLPSSTSCEYLNSIHLVIKSDMNWHHASSFSLYSLVRKLHDFILFKMHVFGHWLLRLTLLCLFHVTVTSKFWILEFVFPETLNKILWVFRNPHTTRNSANKLILYPQRALKS